MEAYAVLETGGKQHLVHQGDVVEVERLEADVGEKVEMNNVLAISDGTDLKVGTPLVDEAKVSVEIVEHLRGRKVVAFKKKRRKGYKRKVGHRQNLTKIKIVEL